MAKNDTTFPLVLPTFLLGSAIVTAGCVQVSVCETHPDLCTADANAVVDDNCEKIPHGAVGAKYAFDLDEILSGVYGQFGEWEVLELLPPGLSLDAETGIISGVPTESGTLPLKLAVTSLNSDEQIVFSCGELGVKDRLSALDVRFEKNHCIPHTTSREGMLARLTGGDGSVITCRPLEDNETDCPLGDGNGRLPPGITFDASTCTHSGEITGDRRGTWVWMVEIEQNGYVTSVPFCATNDVDTLHEMSVQIGDDFQSDLVPGLLEYDPDMAPVFGAGNYIWSVEDPQCEEDPAQCNHDAHRFDVNCSPFDKAIESNRTSTNMGFKHDLTVTSPVPSETFSNRPWVTSFHFSYATSASKINESNFDAKAQTEYHFDVIAFPVEL